jgi:RND family efflux transporter MFP subunit
VRRGQAVARIDAADLTLAVASARAQVASLEAETTLADAEYKRYRDLREKNFISQAEFDRRANTLATSQSKLAAARAQERQAANQVTYTTLLADTAGVITAVEAEAGQVVAAGQTVARLAQPGEKEIVFSVPENQIEFVQNSPSFRVSLNARPGKTWQGRLRELSPAADPATRTYAARVTILAAGDDVDLGMSARATVEAGGQATRIEIPIAALHARGENAQVYLVDGGAVRPQAVKTAGVTGERVVVESGLKPGDVVVAAGANLLRPGQRVRVLNEK